MASISGASLFSWVGVEKNMKCFVDRLLSALKKPSEYLCIDNSLYLQPSRVNTDKSHWDMKRDKEASDNCKQSAEDPNK